MSMAAVEVKDLVKVFDRIKAVDGLSFRIDEGEIYGLVGPNGAGKTTTLRIIATLISPTSGEVKVFGINVSKEPEKIREFISYLPEEAGAYKNLTGAEYLGFMAKLYSRNSAETGEIVERGISISGLGERLNDKIKTYSKGMKRRLLIARALMNLPKLAILDEPTSGLDVIYSFQVRDTIKRFVKEYGITVLLSSHNMLEVEYLCNRIGLLNRGRIVAEGSPDELKASYNASNLEEVFMKVSNND